MARMSGDGLEKEEGNFSALACSSFFLTALSISLTPGGPKQGGVRRVRTADEMLKRGAGTETARKLGIGAESAFYSWALGPSLSLPLSLNPSSPL